MNGGLETLAVAHGHMKQESHPCPWERRTDWVILDSDINDGRELVHPRDDFVEEVAEDYCFATKLDLPPLLQAKLFLLFRLLEDGGHYVAFMVVDDPRQACFQLGIECIQGSEPQVPSRGGMTMDAHPEE